MRVLVLTARTDLPEAHLLQGLTRRGVEIHVVCEAGAPHQELLSASGISLSYHTFSSRLSPSSVYEVRKIVQKGKFDLIHHFSARALSCGLLGTTGLPVRHVAYRGTVGHLSRIDPSSWLSFLHPRLDRIICVSQAVRQYLIEKGIDSHKAVTIYKGHRTSWYEGAKIDLRSYLNIPSDHSIISCAANMRAVKGVDVLLEAFNALPSTLNAHLVLIGEVRDDRIEKLIADTKDPSRLHILGYRSDATALIAGSDLFVMPSIAREGLPKAVIEAMSVGVCPIVSAVGGMPELVLDEECGAVVPPKDKEALAQAITRLTLDPVKREELANAARARIENHFSIEQTIERTLSVYQELAAISPYSASK